MRTFVAFALALLVGIAQAQVRPVYSSIESLAAGANEIHVGKVVKIGDSVVESYHVLELTIAVSDTLKGKGRKQVLAHRYQKEARDYYERAIKAGAEFVWFVPKDQARSEISLQTEFSEYARLGGLAIGMDYSILKSRQEVISRIRQFLKENKGAKGGAALLTPLPETSLTAFVDFLIPIGPWTEKLAVRMITEPATIKFGPPTGNPYTPASDPDWVKSKAGLLRTEGLILLQHFRSKSNIALAKSFLNDDSVAVLQSVGQPGREYFWVRDAAYRLLKHWDQDVERPVLFGGPLSFRDGLYMTEGRRISSAFRT